MSPDTLAFAPEGIPEKPAIMYRSGTLGIQQIRGINIRHGRIRLGMTWETFAAAVHVTPDYLKKIEDGGATPRRNTLVRIARKLDRTVADLGKLGN